MNYILKRMEKASDKKLAEINKIHKLHKIHDTMVIKAILKRARKNLKGAK